MIPLSKQQIIGGFNRRDPTAREWICRKYYAYVRGIVEEITGHSPETMDLVGDVFRKLLDNPGRFKKLNMIRLFLFTTTRNICLNYLRDKKHDPMQIEELEPGHPLLTDNSMEEAENFAAIRNVIYCALQKLPAQTRQIAELGYLQGFPNAEIAARLGIAEKTVGNSKTIALKLLRAELPEIKRRFFLLLSTFLP